MHKLWRKRTPTVIQMEAVECGAACLGILLGFYGKFVPLEELRLACGVSRDGSNAFNLIRAAKTYGLEGKGYQMELSQVYELDAPAILFWEFNHYLVLEGFKKDRVFLNDPGFGPRTLSYEEFALGYSGVVLMFTPMPAFQPGGAPRSLIPELCQRLQKVHSALLYVFLAGIGLLLPGLALPALIRIFIDGVLVAHLSSWTGIIFFGICLAAIVGGALSWLRQYVLLRLNGRLSIQFSSDFLWHLLKLPAAFYTQRFPGEIAYRTQLNNQIVNAITGPLATAAVDFLLVTVYGVAMLQYDLAIGSVGCLAALLNIGVFLWVQRSRSDAFGRVQQEKGKWVGTAIGAIQHIETIKATGIEFDFFAKFAGYYARNLNAQQEIGKKDALLGTAAPLLQALAIAALLSIGSLRIMEGHLSFGKLIALQTLLICFLGSIARFVNFSQILQNVKINFARLNDVLKNPIDPMYSARVPCPSSERRKLEGYLEFRNVTFGYAPLDPPLIERLSFQIKPGQRLALVGPSGSGKSTLAKLAAGLYKPWSGEILYDGKPLSALSPDLLHHSLATVDQEICLFSGTIAENVTFWNSIVTDEMLIRSCLAACIHEEILQRPKGYETLLTENGKNLSGGQRQRLEIARALLYSPSLLILDEATSSLDSTTEKEISNTLRKLGCSMMMIAHRLSTIQDCDEILVLDRGKVVQRGAHQKLKQMAGLYSDLCQLENDFHE